MACQKYPWFLSGSWVITDVRNLCSYAIICCVLLSYPFDCSLTLSSYLPSFLPCSFLLDHGAFPALVNNEGDTPLDLAEDSEEILDALQERVDRDMIDMEAVRGVEEAMMLADANMLKNDHTLQPIVSHAGATPLHVAASKNYVQVIK